MIMKLSEIALVENRHEQLALLVLHSKHSSQFEKKQAKRFLAGERGQGTTRRVIDASINHGLTSIDLASFAVSKQTCQPENPFPAEFPIDESALREQLKQNPSIASLAKDSYSNGLITGLRNVRIMTHEQAQQEWNAQPGYIQMHPVMPLRKNSVINSNAACQFHHSCSFDICRESCLTFQNLSGK